MRHRTRGAKWLAVLLGAVLLSAVPVSTAIAEDVQGDEAVESAPQAEVDSTTSDQGNAEPRSLSEVYVSAKGNDDTGDGTESAPYASLAKAVEKAQDGATIYVMSDLEMHKCARFYDKSLTITSGVGGPYTLSRSTGFDTLSDPARTWYNPALIEVGNTSEGTIPTQLTLTNIVLDDSFAHEGKYFIQAASKGGGTHFGSMDLDNLDIVQDAMIATYAPSATINLGDGAILKDFGGMSAVRLTGGSHLNMLSGSKIYDSKTFDRDKGTTITGADKGLYGPAGAIWSQGGNVAIEKGASIEDVNGRALYMDGGSAAVDGTISGIKSDGDMWQGTTGFVIHLRGGAQAEIGSNGNIDGAGLESPGTAIDVPGGCKLTTADGSIIKDLNRGTAISTNGTVVLAGEITGCRGWQHAITAQSGNFHVTLEPTAYIHDNYCGYGTIYAQSTGGVLDVYGRINDNVSNDRAGGIAMANNYAGTKVNMYDGAEICGNVSYQTGGGIMISCGTFTMNGGTIANNISGVGTDDSAKAGGGVFVRRGGQFIMNGGTITKNTAAGIGGNIAFETDDFNGMTPYVQINGGTVTSGTMKVSVAEENDSYSVTGGEANDIAIAADTSKDRTMSGKTSRYLSVSDEVNLSEHAIFMDEHHFYLEDSSDAVKIGNAAGKCEQKATDAFKDERLTQVAGSYWYETQASTETFTVSGLGFDESKPLYAAVLATGEDGLPVEDTEVSLYTVDANDDGSFSLSLPGQSATGYAVVFLQQAPESETNVVTVTPVDVTVYEGGKGYTAVVDGSGQATDNSMPHPLFKITGVDDASGLTFSNGTSNKTWTAVSDGGSYYHFVAGKGQENVRVTYTNATGQTVTSDEFDVTSAGDTFEQFTIGLYLGDNNLAHITATKDSDSYAVALGTGTLTVRAIEATNPDAVVTSVASEAPSDPLPSGSALAVEPAGTTYTLNDTEVELPDDAEPSLLFDDIITSDGIDREPALQAKADEFLGEADPGRQYETKYLDLVDANNSNAWITSSEGTDIYWAYPEGTDESTDFALLHFEGLHRDGAASGYDTDDIDAAEVEQITIEKTAQGIKFHAPAGGFSPFVLVWSTDGQPVGGQTGGTPQTDGTDGGNGPLLQTGDTAEWIAPFAAALGAAAIAFGASRLMKRKR